MHVHVADVDLAIHGFLSQVPVGAQGWTYTTCQAHGVPGTLRCGPGTAVQPHAVTIAAKCVAAAAPSQAKPFHTVYESGYPDAVRNSVTLVHSPRKGVVCVLEARDRPVECLLHCKDECQTKIGKYCP